MSHEAPLDARQCDEALSLLLREHPDAMVLAMDAEGMVAGLPDSIQLFGQHHDSTQNPLDAMAPSSRPAVYALLARAKAGGAAHVGVVLVDDRSAVCHLFDVRESHGVLVGVLTSGDAGLVEAMAVRPPMVPRIGRVEKDGAAFIRSVDDRICQILGYEAGELLGSRSLDIVHPDEQMSAIEAWMEMLGVPGGSSRLRARQRRKDGSWLWMELTNANLLDGPEGCVVTEMLDVSDEMEAIEQLRQRDELLTRLTDSLPSGVLQVDDAGQVVFTNARLRAVLAVPPASTLVEQLAALAAPDRAAVLRAVDEVLGDGHSVDLEVGLDVPGAIIVRRCAVTIRALTDSTGAPVGALLCVDDVTEASALRAELVRQATVDELTGCLNRTAVLDTLDARLRLHRDASLGTVVLFLDLDGFKAVNDTFGHHEGDRLLTKVAARITGALRTGDVLGRLGGDEFIVIASALASVDAATQLALRINDALVDPLEIVGGLPMRIRASIGAAWSSGSHVTAADLTIAADQAMYRAKRAGTSVPVTVLV